MVRTAWRRWPERHTSTAVPGGGGFGRVLLWGVGSVLLTLAICVALVAGAILLVWGPARPLVVVPEVKGLPLAKAEERLKAAGLQMKVVGHEYNQKVKEGAVIRSSPAGGMVVRQGRAVRLVISRGARLVKTPKLVGLTLAEATERLAEADLQLGEQERQRSDEPADIVLAQDPAPGTRLPHKAKVNVMVSGGRDFDEYRVGEQRFLFRTVKLIVPRGKALQHVQVEVSGGGMEERAFFEDLCEPGEVVRVDLYGPEGARVRIFLEGERVFSARL